jgi:lipopolysaccharide/colanic/teichoic acid biosynthesis glycosyltransferase
VVKRTYDVLVAAVGLAVLSPLFAVCALLIKSDSRGPVFFRQERVGRGFRPFEILKFRSMVEDAPQIGGCLTMGGDRRVTRVGRILRKMKIDELPQLFNVLKGEMSLVGPRPETPCYVDMFREDYEEILQVRPGITDLASLKYRNEASLLAASEDAEREYIDRVLPDKIRLAKRYIRQRSFSLDVTLIARTLLLVWCRRTEKK